MVTGEVLIGLEREESSAVVMVYQSGGLDRYMAFGPGKRSIYRGAQGIITVPKPS